jgi:hypothetical protein
MSVYNRKLFFNRGGQVNARGTGITSGLDTPKRGYVDGPGSYAGVDPMAKARQVFNAGLMSGTSKQPGNIGSILDILGQSMGAATEFMPDPSSGEREMKQAADGYWYYVDDGSRVFPGVVKEKELKHGEKYKTWLDLQSTGYTGSFEEYLQEIEHIKPEKPKKYFWAVDKETGDDIRVYDEIFDPSTMEKGGANRQGEGDKYVWAYNKISKQMENIRNQDYDPKIYTKDPPKLDANDKYTNNYKDYLKSLPEGTEGTGPGFLEFLDRNKKTQVTKGPTTYEEYALTTNDPTPEGYLEYLEKFKLSQPKSYQEYLLTDDTPTTEEFGEFLDSKKKSGFTTDYKNYLKTLEDESQATGTGFADFLDNKTKKTQADKDYWVWDKASQDYILIKGSEFDPSKHSKEPGNTAMFLTDDTEFSQLVEDTLALKRQQLEGEINPETDLPYTTAEINDILQADALDLAQRRLEALASEQPNILSLEDELEKDAELAKLTRRNKKIDSYIEKSEERANNSGKKIQQYNALDLASEDAIIGKVFQPAREWAGAMMNFLGWDDQEKIENMNDDMKNMVGTINGFVGGNIMSTDVVRALTSLGTLANAENGALPGNLNLKEFETLKDSYATLFNSKEGFDMIIDIYKRDAQIDQMRHEALDNFLLTGTLEGRLFGNQKFEDLKDGEAVKMVKDKIKEARDGMITGSEEFGWSDLSEQFDAVKSKGKLVSDWNLATANGQGTISVTANVQGVNTTFELNMKDAEAGKDNQSVQFLGYSDESQNFVYDGKTYKIQAGPNKPVYEINTGKLDNNDQPIFVIKGFIMGAE